MNKQDIENKLAKLKTDLDAKLTKETAQANRCLEILSHFPIGAPEPTLLYGEGYKCDAVIIYTNLSRADLPAIYAALPGLPCAIVRTSSTHRSPVERITDKENKEADITIIAPYTFDLWTFDKDNPNNHRTVKVSWFTKLGEMVVKVDCELAKTDEAHHERVLMGTQYGRNVYKWQVEGLPRGNRFNFASGDHDLPSHVVVYWYESETDTIGDVIY